MEGGAPAASALGSGLRKLVGILEASALVLSPDTGPLHMAVALDRPVVSLMGYTNPKRTGPYRRYPRSARRRVRRPGRGLPSRWRTGVGRMPRITVRDVLDRVERWRTTFSPA